MKEQKRVQWGGVPVGQNRVGAAWSAYRMVAYKHDHGAQTCPVLGYHSCWTISTNTITARKPARSRLSLMSDDLDKHKRVTKIGTRNIVSCKRIVYPGKKRNATGKDISLNGI
jgi:hypothetical protein